MSVVLAVVLGAIIGLSLGALGGGGSILTVPALVYILGQSAHQAVAESLIVVGVTSIVAAISHARAHHVRWGTGAVFGVLGVVTSYLGSALSALIDPNLLLLAFAALVLIAAVAMWTRTRPKGGKEAAPPTRLPSDGRWNRAATLRVVSSALIVGFLTGFLGVGGGFVIVPALVLSLGMEMPIAVGTSLLVIAINCAVSLVPHLGTATIDWKIVIPFTLGAVAASLGGKLVADKASGKWLTRSFVFLLIAVAIYVATRSILALTA
ncbi:MAG: sulfite exporter TauE/SafE family protein [Leifsonia sp.]